MEVSFVPMGHLLGAAAVVMKLTDPAQTIVFGGDLGRYQRPVLPDPQPIQDADVLLCESTYGDRLHEPDDQGAKLAAIVSETAARGGKVIIPAFAIGRVEEVLYWLKRLEDEKRIPVLPVYVDSPMAIEGAAAAREPLGRARRRAAGIGPQVDGVCDEALRERHVTAPVRRPRPIDQAGHHRLVERHGHGRPRAGAPGEDAARSAPHGAVRGLPGGGHEGPIAGRRRQSR